jgi:ceramide kinase
MSGKYRLVGTMIHPLLSMYSPGGISPAAHIGDGFMDVILVKKCSKANFLKFLLMTRFAPKKKFELPFVDVVRVKELKIIPKNRAIDFYNADGELMPAGPIHCK